MLIKSKNKTYWLSITRIVVLTLYVLLIYHFDVLAQFEQFKTQGKNVLVKVFDIIKWIALALGSVYALNHGLRLFKKEEDKINVLKDIAWIPFAVLIMFAIPEFIKLVTGQNPLE